MALVTVLVILSLITVVLVSYLSVMRQDRLSTQSYSQGIDADQVALGGIDQVVGDLRSEITNSQNSTNLTVTETNLVIYRPLNPTNAVPQRAGTLTNELTLIKVSRSNVPSYSEGTALASSANTTNASLNGRRISLSRWNAPFLLASFTNAPDWINVTRAGARVVTAAQACNAALTNANFVVGRYAYTVYDVSGLIDVTAAGYPSTGAALTSANIGRKGFLAFADLTQIPNGSATLTQAQVDALVNWRNASNASSYYSYLTNFAATNGFRRVAPGDNTFLSRQDLIHYAEANGITNALPYLTTFTCENTAPSWTPRYDASDLGGNNGSGNIYAYKSQANSTNSINRDLANVRNLAGGPLLPTRFRSTASASSPRERRLRYCNISVCRDRRMEGGPTTTATARISTPSRRCGS